MIGHSLDASVTINASGELYDLLAHYEKDLRSIFIVSELTLIKPDDADTSDNSRILKKIVGPFNIDPTDITDTPDILDRTFISTEISGLSIKVGAAAGEKCQRCLIYDPSVSEHPDNESLCSRFQAELDSRGS